jgi:hypothetical protein
MTRTKRPVGRPRIAAKDVKVTMTASVTQQQYDWLHREARARSFSFSHFLRTVLQTAMKTREK